MPQHAHGGLRVHRPTIGALCLGPRHVGISVAFDLRWLGIAAFIETDCPGEVSQLGQLNIGAVASCAKGRGSGAGGAGVESRGGRTGKSSLFGFISLSFRQDRREAATHR